MNKFNTANLSSMASQARSMAESGSKAAMGKINEARGSAGSPGGRDRASSTSSSFSAGGTSRTEPPPSPFRRTLPGTAGSSSKESEKEAFFALMDEYFDSRPHLKERLFGAGAPAATPAAASYAAPPTRAPVAAVSADTATALYDFAGTDGDDLPVSEGQVVTILERVSDDWYKCELGGRTGMVPSSYLQQ